MFKKTALFLKDGFPNGLWEVYAVTQDGQIIPLRLLWKSAKRIYNDLTDTNAYVHCKYK